jgi:hypothetical protein
MECRGVYAPLKRRQRDAAQCRGRIGAIMAEQNRPWSSSLSGPKVLILPALRQRIPFDLLKKERARAPRARGHRSSRRGWRCPSPLA